MFEVKMMPGQKPYTSGELDLLYALVDAAAVEDQGEVWEKEVAN